MIKYIKKLLGISNSMEIDEAKVQSKITELNRLGGNWFAVDGMHALTTVAFKGDSPLFNPASGILLKVFINKVNGEIKTFPAIMFAVENNADAYMEDWKRCFIII